jgi:hypothetical protein
MKRWVDNYIEILRDFLSALGLFWLLLQFISYFFTNFSELLKTANVFQIILFASFIYGVLKNYPKSSCCRKIRDRDSYIELKIGDAFSNNGALVVPINNEFDIALDGNVKKANSIQNRAIEILYSSKEEHLENDIRNKVDLNNVPFPMGTVVEVEQNNKRLYLLANSQKGQNNRSNSTIDDFMSAIYGLWDFLSSDSSKDESVTVPLINTQHGRNPNLTREVAVKQIIDTFIESSKTKSVCEKLIISIYPNDIAKGGLNFDSLSDYLSFQCENYKDIKFDSKPEGKAIEESSINKIEN